MHKRNTVSKSRSAALVQLAFLSAGLPADCPEATDTADFLADNSFLFSEAEVKGYIRETLAITTGAWDGNDRRQAPRVSL